MSKGSAPSEDAQDALPPLCPKGSNRKRDSPSPSALVPLFPLSPAQTQCRGSCCYSQDEGGPGLLIETLLLAIEQGQVGERKDRGALVNV